MESKPAGADREVLIAVIETQTEIARRGLDLAGVMDFVAERAMRLTAADGAVVELAEGEDMVYRAVAGMTMGQLGLRLKRATSLTGRCVAENRALRCDDSETDDRVDREACRKVGLRSMVVVPLVHHERPVGVLKVLSSSAHAFADDAGQALELMSGLIAASIFHAAKHETSELYRLATHDALTGLPNRALFYDRLRQSVALARRRAGRMGLVMLDMDNLKPINDAHGHRAGDAAIRETAARIKNTSRSSDTAARLGGDEFAVILSDVRDQDTAHSHANRIAGAIRAPFEFEGKALPLDASVGAVVFPEEGEDIDTLVERADQSMYENKRARKDAVGR